jgi:AhpC/TSA family
VDSERALRSPEDAVLRNRQLIPPLTIHTPDGRTVRAWDYKQKKNLVIVFLDANCGPCEEFLRALTASAAALREKDAVALLVFLEQPARLLTDSLPPGIIVGSDMPGRSARAFLGEDAFASGGFVRPACSLLTATVNSSLNGRSSATSFPRSQKF